MGSLGRTAPPERTSGLLDIALGRLDASGSLGPKRSPEPVARGRRSPCLGSWHRAEWPQLAERCDTQRRRRFRSGRGCNGVTDRSLSRGPEAWTPRGRRSKRRTQRSQPQASSEPSSPHAVAAACRVVVAGAGVAAHHGAIGISGVAGTGSQCGRQESPFHEAKHSRASPESCGSRKTTRWSGPMGLPLPMGRPKRSSELLGAMTA